MSGLDQMTAVSFVGYNGATTEKCSGAASTAPSVTKEIEVP